jgi:transposase
VCPATGEAESLIVPHVDKCVKTQHHLEQISAKIKPGRYAVVIMDGAGWHQASLVEGFKNVNIIKLPLYSPELNPIEQVWSGLRQHHLANRCFNGYEDIIDACSLAWNDFVSDTLRVTKMCSRDWLEKWEKLNTDWYKTLWLGSTFKYKVQFLFKLSCSTRRVR